MMGRNEIRSIWNLLRAHRVTLALGVLALGLQTFLLLPIALLVHDIFAVHVPASDTRALLAAGLGILALYTASTLLSLIARRLILVAVFTSIADLRMQVFDRLHQLPLSWHERQDVGRLHGTVVADCERLGAALPPSLVAVLQALVVGGPLAIVAVVVSPLLAGVVAVAVPPILLLNGRLKARTGRAIQHWMSTHRDYAAYVLRMLRTAHLIRVRGADESELKAVRERIGKMTETSIDKSWSSNLASILNGAVAGVTGALILVVGGVAVTAGTLTLSQLLTFYAVIALMLRNVTGAAGAGANLMAAVASLAPLQEIVEYPLPRIYGGTARRPFDGTVALRDVTFGYRDTPVLGNLDLAITAGERVAVVGPNGAGKSTIARLILGLERPWEGTVFAGGHPLDELDLPALRRQIGVVLQDAAILPGTIRENVAFGRPGLTAAQIEWALDASGVTAMLDDRFPDGVDTEVGDDGACLSGGQRQSIAIARALAGEPRLLILDEPTNHLDAAAIPRLMNAVEAMPIPPAVLLITHDAELPGWADRVVRLGDRTAQASRTTVRSA